MFGETGPALEYGDLLIYSRNLTKERTYVAVSLWINSFHGWQELPQDPAEHLVTSFYH